MAAVCRLLSFPSSVTWPLVSTVQVYAINGCELDELDMSNSLQGYDWMNSLVLLEARNGKMLERIHLVGFFYQ